MRGRSDEQTAAALIPPDADLPELRRIASGCTACPLYRLGTQTVFGEGPGNADVLLAGEQPGNDEDLAGRPFVGPAGKLLDRSLEQAGIDRSRAYVTNTVKHFKWEPRGKRRIHAKPNPAEIRACMPWLVNEIRLVQPRAVVCLGATAAQALLGRQFRVTQERGRIITATSLAPAVMATIHPSAILRAPDEAARREAHESFVEDLRAVQRWLEQAS